MIKALLSVSLGLVLGALALGAAAHAAPAAGDAQDHAQDKVMTGRSVAHDYWLSDGLNSLVFWHAPARARADATPPR